jgi:hypothetical protein
MAPEEQISLIEGTNKTLSKEQISSTRETKILRMRNKSRLLREQKWRSRNKSRQPKEQTKLYPRNKSRLSGEQE